MIRTSFIHCRGIAGRRSTFALAGTSERRLSTVAALAGPEVQVELAGRHQGNRHFDGSYRPTKSRSKPMEKRSTCPASDCLSVAPQKCRRSLSAKIRQLDRTSRRLQAYGDSFTVKKAQPRLHSDGTAVEMPTCAIRTVRFSEPGDPRLPPGRRKSARTPRAICWPFAKKTPSILSKACWFGRRKSCACSNWTANRCPCANESRRSDFLSQDRRHAARADLRCRRLQRLAIKVPQDRFVAKRNWKSEPV